MRGVKSCSRTMAPTSKARLRPTSRAGQSCIPIRRERRLYAAARATSFRPAPNARDEISADLRVFNSAFSGSERFSRPRPLHGRDALPPASQHGRGCRPRTPARIGRRAGGIFRAVEIFVISFLSGQVSPDVPFVYRLCGAHGGNYFEKAKYCDSRIILEVSELRTRATTTYERDAFRPVGSCANRNSRAVWSPREQSRTNSRS